MPQNNKRSDRNSGGIALVAIGLAVVFDALRIACNWLWLIGPVFAGAYCVQPAIGVLCTTIGAFGLILAIMVGLAGWLTVGTLLMIGVPGAFRGGSGWWFVGGLLISEIPFLGSVPALTATTIKAVHGARKRQKEAQKKEAAQNDALAREQERETTAAVIAERRLIEEAQFTEAEEEAAEQEAANDDDYTQSMSGVG